MKYTDTQLKQALAKMLPEKVRMMEDFNGDSIQWLDWCRPVLDTELLHLCWLVEETLIGDQWDDYHYEFGFSSRQNMHATWQQRVIALAKVKGIEI
jgi:hypothetical protein